MSESKSTYHEEQMELLNTQHAHERAKMSQENRRFGVQMGVEFYRNTTRGVVSTEAALHTADLFFQYAEHGTLPDAERCRAAVRDYVESAVQHAFPASVIGALR